MERIDKEKKVRRACAPACVWTGVRASAYVPVSPPSSFERRVGQDVRVCIWKMQAPALLRNVCLRTRVCVRATWHSATVQSVSTKHHHV